jgi:MFS family permease
MPTSLAIIARVRGAQSSGFGLVVPPVVALVLSPLIFRLASGEWRLVVLALAIPLGLFPLIVLVLSIGKFKARLSLSTLKPCRTGRSKEQACMMLLECRVDRDGVGPLPV